MSEVLIIFCVAAVSFRLIMLAVSIRHERALKRDGAVELGAGNTLLLTLLHIAYYASAITEGALRAAPIDGITIFGMILYVLAMIALLAVVRLLGRFWTVKLLIARDHQLVSHPLFRWVRHPNYFLNILPELAGLALALDAYVTLVIGLPIYVVSLMTRIRQEEAAMTEKFDRY
jgi:isoprenylcysteine carboxyl methyltransferase (ICMT) family protein YpbQ